MDLPDFLHGQTSTDERKSDPGRGYRLSDAEQRQRATWSALLMSGIFYAVIIRVVAAPEGEEIARKAFGSHFGIPPRAVACLIVSALYLPFPWILWHCMLITFKNMEDGLVGGRFSLMVHLFTIPERHPSFRRSQRIAIVGLMYFLALCFGWIAYTASLGI